MNFEEENNQLGRNFMQRMYFDEYAKPYDERRRDATRIELQSSYKCNLNCKYCYVVRHGDKLYPEVDDETIYENAERIVDWMIENGYVANYEIFSGEPLIKDVNFRILGMILDKYENEERKPNCIQIPTNMTWIKNEDFKNRVVDLLDRSREENIPIKLSMSIDGKYCTDNRPPITFTDKEYDELFTMAKKYKFGCHPMVYSEEIENWKKNWDWFQEQFRKHNLPIDNIYLLEVRNREWSKEQINKFAEFLEYIIDWTNERVDDFVDFMYSDGYNILRSPFTTHGRGVGCSIQSTPQIRLADLALTMCHRTSYDEFILGKFDEDMELNIFRPELLIGHTIFNQERQPMCEKCMINKLCTGQCMGAMYEYTGDLFSPIPNVCRLEFKKIATLINKYKEIGVLDSIKLRSNDATKVQTENMEKIL